MINNIYALVEVKSRTKFYVGFTSRDPKERLREHKSASKNYCDGGELKYKYAHALDELEIEWTLELLHSVDITNEYAHDDVEDYYINLYRHEPLQNMRAGMTSAWMGVDYSNIDEFLSAKKRHLARASFKEPKIKRETVCNPEQMIFSFEKPSKFTAPAFEKLAKRAKKR